MAPRVQALPKYLTLARRFERQLRSGTLRVGDRLPSVRQLRRDHRVSAATAVSCYLWLERQGYVRARAKSGFYVGRLPQTDGPPPETTHRARRPIVLRGSHLYAPLAAPDVGRGGLDLGSAVISPALLPVKRLNRSIRTVLAAFEESAGRREDTRGNVRLRRQVARLMFRQGTECGPDDVIVTAGSTEALSLAVRATTAPGDVVAVESPGCFEMLEGLEAFNLRALEVPHRAGGGLDLDQLRAVVRRHRVKAVMLNATCHNPVGDCATDEMKAALARFAAQHGVAIIESDTFGDLVFSGRRPRTVKSFDRAGRVLQCASLAHFVAPGFNIGWLSAGRYQPAVERLKGLSTLTGAGLTQLALAEFLESGAFDRHLRRLRVELWRTIESARLEVIRHFPAGTRVSRPEGGFVLWIQLPEGSDGEAVRRRAAAEGVHILSGAVFSPNRLYRPYVRLACGYPFDVLKPAIRTIASCVRSGH